MKTKRYLIMLVFLGMFGTMGQTMALTPAEEGTSFQIIGHIQSFKLFTSAEVVTFCPGTDPLLIGARMVVNGIDVIIPCKTIITMPATYLTPKDIFDFNPNNIAGESGLALEDTKPPLAAIEVALDGNIVTAGGVKRHVAGMVHISQQSLNNGAGYITAIDADGTMHVGPSPTSPSVTDARIRINDSDGRFGLQTSFLGQGSPPPDAPNKIKITEDGRFTADTGNPTIHASTGYPMCLPRGGANDLECPTNNRPMSGGIALSFFVMGSASLPPPAPGQPAIPNCPGCDSEKQAPLMIGDYINYAGTLAKDTAGFYISAHTIDAWVGIYTEPGAGSATTKVAYINQEVSLVGTGARTTDPVFNPGTGAAIDHEVAPRTVKVEGFTTDPSRPVEVFALSVDPCTGDMIELNIGQVPAEVVPFGRFRFIVTRAGVGKKNTDPSTTIPIFIVTEPVKELIVRVPNGVKDNVANGLTSGQFTAPVSEFIFAENTFFGDPLVPFNFHRFSYLAQGSGPLSTVGRVNASGKGTGPVVRQIAPWPGEARTSFGAPTPLPCP